MIRTRYFIIFFTNSIHCSLLSRPTSRILNNTSDLHNDPCKLQYLRYFSTGFDHGDPLSWGGSTYDILLNKLKLSLRDRKLNEGWDVLKDFKKLYGFPPLSVVDKLITQICYSDDHGFLHRGCDFVSKVALENPELLHTEILPRLCLSLARSQLPVLAAKILRLLLKNKNVSQIDVLGLAIMHMVKSEIGSHLASNILFEICDCFDCLSSRKRGGAVSMKLDTMIFNLVLDGCVRFGSSLKAQRIIELMAKTGIVGDLHSIVLFSCVYEMNGQRDELKKHKEFVDRVSVPLVHHYRVFYDKLLRLYFKFDDLDAAASLVVDMSDRSKSRPLQKSKALAKPCVVPIGSRYLKEVLSIQILPESLEKDSVINVEGKPDLLLTKNGRLALSSKGLAQLITRFRRNERISELSKLLVAIQKDYNSCGVGSLCSDVINACIYIGWLETAHDILDDMETIGAPVPTNTYMLLLKFYCKKKMYREAKALLKQIKRVGLQVDVSEEMIDSEGLSGSTMNLHAEVSSCQSELANCLVREMKGEIRCLPAVYELNCSIYFFCKAKMMEDALRAYRQMQAMNILPTVQTFVYLIDGYSNMKMYRQITILWGDIKRNMEHGNSFANRDLYELLLLNFLRGGYFVRALEVIGRMREHGIYADRFIYKQEYLTFHKNLYRNLRALDAKDDVQRQRLEHVRAFKKWVSTD